MIKITRLNGTEVIMNAELIEFIESTPETVITLIDGKRLTSKESVEEVMEKIIAYKQAIFSHYPLHNKQKAHMEGKDLKVTRSLADWIENDDESKNENEEPKSL